MVIHMKTSQTEDRVKHEEREPVLSISRVIEVAPSSVSFSGWGPKIIGTSNILNRWN